MSCGKAVEPLLRHQPDPRGGHPRSDDRACFGAVQFRRLRIRWERDATLHLAFLSLGCAIICHRHLKGF
jgi:hypothetical protein